LASCNGTPAICNVTPIVPFPALVYPAPNATGVPAGPFTLVLTSGARGQVSIFQARTVIANDLPSASVPSPLPSPHATLSPYNSPAGYAVPKLTANTRYGVLDTYAATSGPCPSAGGSQVIGSFSTR
jgi:hypothetical protein